MRFCSRCKTDKPLSSFYEVKRKSGNTFHSSWCKQCFSSKKRELSISPKSAPLEIKRCSICNEGKHNSLYTKNSRNYDGLSTHCKSCKKSIDYNCNLKRKYNITKEIYLQMKKDQNDTCKICRLEKELVVDHCHSTGKVRGLLCHLCNTLIGFAYENTDILSSAITYVNATRTKIRGSN